MSLDFTFTHSSQTLLSKHPTRIDININIQESHHSMGSRSAASSEQSVAQRTAHGLLSSHSGHSKWKNQTLPRSQLEYMTLAVLEISPAALQLLVILSTSAADRSPGEGY